jgi:hypothetical protein
MELKPGVWLMRLAMPWSGMQTDETKNKNHKKEPIPNLDYKKPQGECV